MAEYELITRLLVAVLLGGIIGFERGIHHDAGLRTHIIVCLGAAAIMVLSECFVKKYGIETEIMRMAAQVVSGVGFLGAGSIVVDGNRVRGITTAAGIWTTACVGLVVGGGYYIIAISIVLLMLISMLGLRSIKTKLREKGKVYSLKVELEDGSMVQKVFEIMVADSVEITNMKIEETDGKTEINLEINTHSRVNIEELVGSLCKVCTVKEFLGV